MSSTQTTGRSTTAFSSVATSFERPKESHDRRTKVRRPDYRGKPIEPSQLSTVRDGQGKPLPADSPEDKICLHCQFVGWPYQTQCPKCGKLLVNRCELS